MINLLKSWKDLISCKFDKPSKNSYISIFSSHLSLTINKSLWPLCITYIFISASMAWILFRRLEHSSLRALNSAVKQTGLVIGWVPLYVKLHATVVCKQCTKSGEKKQTPNQSKSPTTKNKKIQTNKSSKKTSILTSLLHFTL